MATTDTGFTPKGNLRGSTTGIKRDFIIGDMKTITVGDMVRLADGFIDLAAAGNPILGCVVGFRDANGLDLSNSRADYDGTWTESTKTYVSAGDNSTDHKIRAIVEIDPFTIYSGQPDDAIATHHLAGEYGDLVAASDQVDADTVTNSQAQMFYLGLDPENTARGLYVIAEHQIWGA